MTAVPVISWPYLPFASELVSQARVLAAQCLRQAIGEQPRVVLVVCPTVSFSFRPSHTASRLVRSVHTPDKPRLTSLVSHCRTVHIVSLSAFALRPPTGVPTLKTPLEYLIGIEKDAAVSL